MYFIYYVYIYICIYIYMGYHDIISWEFHYGYHGLKWGYIGDILGDITG